MLYQQASATSNICTESLKNYFSQFGEVVECTVMRDGATGRSRGFGFLTFKDPKTVNTVMVKEHQLDGKLVRLSNDVHRRNNLTDTTTKIDPKRAIPRDEQERTAKIFVGGVSQDATESDFKEFFTKFGRVLDATLMMDKDTGRPRGFGFVTFDNDMAVERTLEGPLSILGKPIEVKRAQPRGKMGEDEPPHSKFGRGGKGAGWGNNNGGGNGGGNGGFNPSQMAQGGGGDAGGQANGMTPAMMAQYWQRMQQYFAMMQGMQAGNMGGAGMMNPQMMQNPMMQQMMAQRGMNPQMMQQMMMQQQAQQGQGQGGQSPGMNGSASPGPGAQQGAGGFNAQEQMMFEQQKYEQQQQARMRMAQGAGGGNAWDGMYDDEPQPQGMGGGFRGGRGGGGFRGGRGGGPPANAPNAPAGAPTGPKNAGRPGANYRGGGRGRGNSGFHPYARGGG